MILFGIILCYYTFSCCFCLYTHAHMNLEYYAINTVIPPWRCCELAVPGRSRCGTHGILCNIRTGKNSRWKIDWPTQRLFCQKGNCVSLFDSYTQGKFLPWLYLMTISNYFIKVFIYTYKACLIKINSLIRLSWELCLLAPWENGMKFLPCSLPKLIN